MFPGTILMPKSCMWPVLFWNVWLCFRYSYNCIRSLLISML